MAARKNYTAAQIINGLRRAEVGLANGKSMKEVIRDLVLAAGEDFPFVADEKVTARRPRTGRGG